MPDTMHIDIAAHRLRTAHECLEEAQLLMHSEKYRAAVSRLYYAIFHGMKAVLALEAKDFKKHSAVIGYFRQNYVKTGMFSSELSATITALFDARSKSDYDDWYLIDKSEVVVYLQKATAFVDAADKYVQEHSEQ